VRFPSPFAGRLYRKYVAAFALLIGAVLVAGAVSDLYFSYHEARDAAVALNREKATAAAIRIEQFVREIEQHLAWTNLLPPGTDTAERRRLEFIKLLRQAPAITDAVWMDARGREQLRVSRLAVDRLHSGVDYSLTPAFREAEQHSLYRGPVYFREASEPYMTLAVRAGEGVTLVEVNLKFVRDVIIRASFGRTGHAYVVDRHGLLVSHPDISLVLKRSDLSRLEHVRRALAASRFGSDVPADGNGHDLAGRAVLVAHARVEPPGWTLFVSQQADEAYTPLVAAMWRTAALMALGLLLAVAASALLARRMVRPIQALRQGAERLGSGQLDQRIEVHSGDELEQLAAGFNQMAARLRESYAGLEQKVEARTRELVAANQAKSRFLAAASHDLRQPMHALGLFVAQLNARVTDSESRHLADRIDAAVTALRGLLDALLDVSRLDAGVVTPALTDLQLADVLGRIEAAFDADAADRGLRFRVRPCRLAAHSDPVLLERILINLVANALRYTDHGGILVGCRCRGDRVRVEVWDTGVGIAPGEQMAIFQEFYQVGNIERDRRKGLGLGLAIASRLARLLGGRIDLRSVPGRGSMFAVELPAAKVAAEGAHASAAAPESGRLRGALVLVIDDDTLARESIEGLLRQWECEVAGATDGAQALAVLARLPRPPGAIICDYRLPGEENGLEVIRRCRAQAMQEIPAALISGDTAPERLREARASGIPLLHKPAQPARLRALLEFLLADEPGRARA